VDEECTIVTVESAECLYCISNSKPDGNEALGSHGEITVGLDVAGTEQFPGFINKP
jgi:hypothetical protein